MRRLSSICKDLTRLRYLRHQILILPLAQSSPRITVFKRLLPAAVQEPKLSAKRPTLNLVVKVADPFTILLVPRLGMVKMKTILPLIFALRQFPYKLLALAPTAAVLVGCATSSPPAAFTSDQISQVQLEIKRQLGVFLNEDEADSKTEAELKTECGSERGVFIVTAVTVDLTSIDEKKGGAGGKGATGGFFLSWLFPQYSRDVQGTQHLTYSEFLVPAASQVDGVISTENQALLETNSQNVHLDSPIADAIRNLKLGLERSALTESTDSKGKLPCITGAPINQKIKDQTFLIGLSTVTDVNGTITLGPINYGPTYEGKWTQGNTITVTFQQWPWEMLPSPEAVANDKTDSGYYTFCQAKNHRVGICRVGKDKKLVQVNPPEIDIPQGVTTLSSPKNMMRNILP